MLGRFLTALAALLVPSVAFADYASVILADGPCHYYHLDEPSGTNAADSETNPDGNCSAIAGTYTGTPTLGATGIPGYPGNAAVTLNGSSQYVVTGSTTNFSRPTALNHSASIEVWANPSSTSGNAQLAGKSNATVFEWFLLRLGTNFAFTVEQATGTCGGADYGNVTGSVTISTGQWYYVVATWQTASGSNDQLAFMTLYVNGVQDATKTSSFTGLTCNSITTPFAIGRRQDNVLYFAGTEDEVAFYRTNTDGTGTGALSAGQVLTHYNGGAVTPSTFGLMLSPVKFQPQEFGPKPLDIRWQTMGNESFPLPSSPYARPPKFKNPVYRGMYVQQ